MTSCRSVWSEEENDDDDGNINSRSDRDDVVVVDIASLGV